MSTVIPSKTTMILTLNFPQNIGGNIGGKIENKKNPPPKKTDTYLRYSTLKT